MKSVKKVTSLNEAEVKEFVSFLLQPEIVSFICAPTHQASLFDLYVKKLSEKDRRKLNIFHDGNSSILGEGRGNYGEKGFAKEFQELIQSVQRRVREELVDQKKSLTVKNINEKLEDFVKRNKFDCLNQMASILMGYPSFTSKLFYHYGELTKLADLLCKFSKVSGNLTGLSDLLSKRLPPSPMCGREHKQNISGIRGTLFVTKMRGLAHPPVFGERMNDVIDVILESKTMRLLFASYRAQNVLYNFFYCLNPVDQGLFHIFHNAQFSILLGQHPFVVAFQSQYNDLRLGIEKDLKEDGDPYTEQDVRGEIEDSIDENMGNCRTDLEVALRKVLINSPFGMFNKLLQNLNNLRKLAELFDQFSQQSPTSQPASPFSMTP